MIKSPSRVLFGLMFSGMFCYGLISSFVSFTSFGNAAGTVLSQERPGATPDGAALYSRRCAACHDNAQDHVPPRAIIAQLSPEQVMQTMTTGVMKPQAIGLSAAEIRAIAVHLTGKQPGAAAGAKEVANRCAGGGGPINLSGSNWNGWGRDLDNSHYQPNPGLKPEDVPKLRLKWAFGYPGAKTWGQPTIIGDRLYVTSTTGMVYCLNARTGCTYWQLDADARSRTAISVGPLPAGAKARFAAYFGDHKAFVHAVDAENGNPIWKTKVDEHPLSRLTGAPVLYQDRLYVPVSSIEEGPGADEKYEC